MSGEYLEPEDEFRTIELADGSVGVTNAPVDMEFTVSPKVIEATCQAAGIVRMPDPCVQCAKCTALQVRLDAMRAKIEEFRSYFVQYEIVHGTQREFCTMLDMIRDAGKAVQP